MTDQATWGRRFPGGARVTQVRFARPTDHLDAVVRFWRDGLGLPEIGSFTDHDGYDGVMLGFPDKSLHLEFTRHRAGSPGRAPSRDNLIVLYVPDEAAADAIAAQFRDLGIEPVPPENPYWRDKSRTFEDPDGWRLVVCNTAGI